MAAADAQKTILVVDDSRAIREVVAGLLRSAGYQVLTAVDGRDGLHKIRATPGIALVLCDVNMPQMSGLEMVAAMRGEPAGSALPVVMITSDMDAAMLGRAKEAGAKGWLIKPFVPNLLLAAVRTFTSEVASREHAAIAR